MEALVASLSLVHVIAVTPLSAALVATMGAVVSQATRCSAGKRVAREAVVRVTALLFSRTSTDGRSRLATRCSRISASWCSNNVGWDLTM